MLGAPECFCNLDRSTAWIIVSLRELILGAPKCFCNSLFTLKKSYAAIPVLKVFSVYLVCMSVYCLLSRLWGLSCTTSFFH